jgi:hypothetical protein
LKAIDQHDQFPFVKEAEHSVDVASVFNTNFINPGSSGQVFEIFFRDTVQRRYQLQSPVEFLFDFLTERIEEVKIVVFEIKYLPDKIFIHGVKLAI